MLGPEIYGVFGMGLVVFTFSYFIATFGFAWSLGQLSEVSDEDIRFAFTWQMTVAFVAAAGLYSSADLAGQYFQDDRVIEIVQWMPIVCVLNGFAAVSGYLMNRELNFKAPGIIQFFSYAIGYIGVGIPCALMGFGVKALLAAWISQAIVGSIGTYLCRPHSLKPLWKSPQAREITRIGSTAFVTNLVNWACNNIDRGIIGRQLDAGALGLYNAGYNLANMPNSLLISALQPVFLRVGSKVQGQASQQSKAFGEILAIIWVVLLPVFFSLALNAPNLIQLFYGKTWNGAAPVLAALFMGMPAYVMWGMSTPVLWNMGKARYEMLLQIPLIPIAAIAYFAFAKLGVFYAALVTSALLLLRGLVVGGVAGHLIDIKMPFVFKQMLRGLSFCGLIYAVHFFADRALNDSLPPLLKLIILSACHATACLGVVALLPKTLGGEASSLIVRFAPKLRGRLLPE